MPRKLLSIGHSYVVTLNRRLVNEMARLGQDSWEVTAIAPSFFQGDLRPLHLEPDPQEACQLKGMPTYFSRFIHFMAYDWQLRSILQQDWDLVHCWEEPYILAGGQVAWWTPTPTPLVYRTAKIFNEDALPASLPQKVPLVYFTNQNWTKAYPPPFNWIERFAMQRATGWICSGHTVADALKNRPGYDLPMRLIPLGVDTAHFYPNPEARRVIRQQLGWGDRELPVIGFLGRLVPDKGIELLLRVLDQVKTPWRALFVGTGVLEERINQWAQRYPDRVRLCTNVHHQDVAAYLNAMDCLCAPSQTLPNWREQFGRMVIEAFACGVPVIGSDSGEIPYVVKEAGLIVAEKDETAWVKAITQLLEQPEQRREFSQRGLERVHSHYTWSIVARQHLQFFNELLDPR